MSQVQRSSPKAPKRSGVVVPHAPKWYQRLGAFLVFISLRGLLLTVRCRMRAPSEYFSPGAPAPVIFCIWHNRLATCVKVLDQHRRPHNSGAGMAALVSASRDGAFLAGILEWFGVRPVRGSSSRRGGQALLELTSWAQRGHDLTITPDGPRGPCYQVQEGIASLAQVTGLPIVPVAMNLNWKIRVKSWDRFQIPLPFARCEVCVGRAIRVPPGVTDDERKQFRQQLEAELRAITKD
jgi:lysophospholipid acyltransferase (LPLAT)-like uncharacterized protein